MYKLIKFLFLLLLLLLLCVKCVNKSLDPLKKQEKKNKRREANSNSIAKAKVICVPLPLPLPCYCYSLRPSDFMTYISSVWARIWCIYLYINMQGTFVYCASFVFVVNKLKMRPNWQRRHSICMRGVRGTLDRQPRLEELCAHGQHKRCFKQPAIPSPPPLPLLSLTPYLVISQTL